MKLYWRYKKDGKWTWKPVGENAAMEGAELVAFPSEEEE